MVFWLIFRVRGYFGHFLGFRVILDIFLGFGGILVILWVLEGILVIFRFWGYFGHLLGFGDIFVIFRFLEYFGHFFWFLGYFGHFFWVLGVFWSFCRFHGYILILLVLESHLTSFFSYYIIFY